MKIQCGNAVYKEAESMVYLLPWAKFDRGPLHMDAGGSVVKLVKGRIDIVETQKATGTREANGRRIDYGADAMVMLFAETGQVSKITGDSNARLTSTTALAKTDVTSDKLVLDFEAGQEESSLSKAYAGGKAVLVSKPAGNSIADTRIVKSDTVELYMRPGGEEIERAETAAPSSLELIPNRPRQTHRWLNGDRFFVTYGKDNQIERFTTTGASTRSEPPPRADRKPNPPLLTWSKDLEANFDPKTGQLARMNQKTDFRYEAGDRRAKSNQADLDQTTDVILLTGAARVWDPTGSTSGDTIHINQKNNDFIAEGNVTSTRLPEKKPAANASATAKNATPMMNREETTQALARKMTARNGNRWILYEGNAVAWQGSNRIAADRIEIDRDNEMLKAMGNVVSQFADRPQDSKGKQKKPVNAAPTFTVVKAPEMIYTEVDHVALYRGGIAHLTRTGLVVKGKQIRAYLNETSDESTLNRAVVDGDAEIVQTGTGANAKRTRTGTAEHADYYPADEKTVLSGGHPRMVDSVKGTTEGRELIYFANTEKLIVDGTEQQRTESVIKRK
jgi:lipopolysaccharide export system protein LptA